MNTEKSNEVILFYMGVLMHKVGESATSTWWNGKKYVGVEREKLQELFPFLSTYQKMVSMPGEIISMADYHKSYNNLMPVVKKVIGDLEQLLQEGGAYASNLYYSIYSALQTCFNGVDILYEAVMPAIKYINECNGIADTLKASNETSLA